MQMHPTLLFASMVLLMVSFPANSDGLTPVVSIEAESMAFGGYTGLSPSSVTFQGLRFYGNGDSATATVQLPHVPGRYSVEVRGASSNQNKAGMSFYIGTIRAATFQFSTSTPSIIEAQFDIKTTPTPSTCKLRLEDDNGSSDTDIDYVKINYIGSIPPPPPPPTPPSTGAFQSGVYRNLFSETGKSSEAIIKKIGEAWQQLFYGDDQEQRVYYPVGSDMAYILDVGNNDVRSEGMSYGMMICVQLNKKTEFDKLWKWARTYMYHTEGEWKGYYAWQVGRNGTVIDKGSAPDGEEYFAMALFFASHRWGNGQGIFNYGAMARELLSEVLHHETRIDQHSSIRNMFNKNEKKVVFSPNNMSALFTDPSYHLPSFYELWALWADADNSFWKAAADTSRAFFKRTVHAQTGLSPDYAEFDGSPNNTGNHGDFRFDAWRTAMNISTDYAWWAKDSWQKDFSNRIQDFFHKEGISSYGNQYTISGTMLSGDQSPGLIAMNAAASLAATDSKAWEFVEKLWDLPPPTGRWRYYDGMLYMLGLLHCSGNYKIYAPGSNVALSEKEFRPERSSIASSRERYTLTGRKIGIERLNMNAAKHVIITEKNNTDDSRIPLR